METFIGEAHAGGMRMVLCGDINVARSERDVYPEERNPPNVVGPQFLINENVAYRLELPTGICPHDKRGNCRRYLRRSMTIEFVAVANLVPALSTFYSSIDQLNIGRFAVQRRGSKTDTFMPLQHLPLSTVSPSRAMTNLESRLSPSGKPQR